MECALFLNKLNNEEMTTWMKNQPFKYVGNWELFDTFKSWGEAIGEALSACEITEKEVSQPIIVNKCCVTILYMYCIQCTITVEIHILCTVYHYC